MRIQQKLKLNNLTIAVAWLVLLICVGVSHAETVYVNAGYEGDEDGSEAKPFNTFKEGVNAAKSGDTVQVAAGTYEVINIEISNMDELNLQGAGADTTIIHLTEGQYILSLSNVKKGKIDGFTLKGTDGHGTGIQLTSSSLTITNNRFEDGSTGISCWRGASTISNNEFTNSGGIELKTTDNATINSNTISGGGISLNASAKATITNNEIHGYHYQGIYCAAGSEAAISHNKITGDGEGGIYFEKASIVVEANTITHNKYHGVYGKASDVVISGNTIEENGAAGITLETSTATISGNEIKTNDYGIEIDNSPNSIIKNNDILDNYAEGIKCGRADVTIEDNTISGNMGKGILCYSSSDVEITNNQITSNTQSGVSIESQSKATITGNKISENSDKGIYISTPGVVDINDNEIQGNMESGIYQDGADSAATIQNNKILENRGDGIANYHGEAKIRCNLIIKNWGPGVGTGWDDTANPNVGTEFDPGNNTIYDNRDYQLKNHSPNDISAVGNYWGEGTEQTGPKMEKEIYSEGGSVFVEPWLNELPPECEYQPPPPSDDKYRSSILLPRGVSIISLPLRPETKYTAKTLADELGATIVIKSEYGGFIAYVPDVELGVDFTLEEGKGYIINLLTQKNFTLTGTPWGAKLAPTDAVVGNIWAFVVVGDVTPNYLSGEQLSLSQGGVYRHPRQMLVNVTNLRTGMTSLASPVDGEGRFTAVFVDMNRNSVVKKDDELEIVVTDGRRKFVKRCHITTAHIEKAYIEVAIPPQPVQSKLLQNFPNPFNPETWLPYQLVNDVPMVIICIYNTKGQLIRMLNIGTKSAGFYFSTDKAAHWDGRDNFGDKVASGAYFYTLQAGKFKATRRMVIVK